MRTARQQGFSLLELIIVVVVIGVLAASGITYYLDALDRARATTVEMVAWRFGQSASVLRAWSRIPANIEPHRHGVDRRGVSWVFLEDTRIYLNENGWPANTDAMVSPAIGDQTAQECEQLLRGILKEVVEYTDEKDKQFSASAIGGRVCRYQLVQNKEEAWFFDYSLETGKVQVSVPRLRIEQYADG